MSSLSDIIIGDDAKVEVVHRIAFDRKSTVKMIVAVALVSFILKKL